MNTSQLLLIAATSDDLTQRETYLLISFLSFAVAIPGLILVAMILYDIWKDRKRKK